ncbi:FG-GAP repeat domain-containing protein [Aliikangiella coralliicola]|uniref:VCBS repeat-containing protein n=1 Tax=Aliikangiella coralliicola TaxID=2592383 RepID=A0A545UG43_9GAMM|nr:VCBS repeat-containing protein [Aliikangiella coralliicola]TQV88373.1 VCBS repeat-containing protein [Aliikangiella coralliicola]
MFRQLLIALLIVGTSFSVSAKIKFNQAQLETDFKITHPVEVVNLLGLEHKQLIIFGENEDKTRLLAIYRFDKASQQYIFDSETEIPENFLAYDFLETQQKHKLIFQTNQALVEYSPTNQSFKTFSEINSIYLRPKAQFLANKDFINDINGDDREDITIVDFKSIHLFMQNEQGGFTQQSVPVTPKIQHNRESATYNETPLFFADLNHDAKKDLITVKDAGLKVFPQNGNGTFKPQAHNLQLPIDISALDWWEIRESDGESLDQNELSHRTIDRIEDINNDQIPDLLVKFSQSEGVLDRQNDYEIYLGKIVEGAISYPDKPDDVISADGTIAGLKIIDIDGDKRSEIMVASFDIGVSQIIGALLSGSIDQDIYFFKMDENDRFGEEPNVDKEVELNFSLSSGKSGEPVVKVADFNGDGVKDLMFSDGEKTLKTYQGNDSQKLFARKSTKHKVLIPKDGELVETTDINNDGKEDIIIRYGRQDDEKLSNKIILLIAS